MKTVSETEIEAIGKVLCNPDRPMKQRFRALFTLKNIGCENSIRCIGRCFGDSSILLKHELAYCLGQMQDVQATDTLIQVLQNRSQDPMVRHEAGEALGALGSIDLIPLLEKYSNDPSVEVAETCQLAVCRLKWLRDSKDKPQTNIYNSVDPAPPELEGDIQRWKTQLLNKSLSLFERYRAMFSLRDAGTTDAVLALAEGFKGSSALFRHEIAFVLGQLQHEASVPALVKVLQDLEEHEMVRHECAEALGSIATTECFPILQKFLEDERRVVRESCEVALDMCDYRTSPEFQYANMLNKVQDQ